jgi:hypothetical protein
MNKTELKYNVSKAEPFFFSRNSMKFFGDTMTNYSVPKNPITITDFENKSVQVYQLKRKKPVGHSRNQETTFFDAITFKRVFPKHETHS